MATDVSVSLPTISETEYLSFLIGHAVDNNFSVALWRLPNDEKKYLIISRQAELLGPDAPLEELPSGFIFAPFSKSSDRIFLRSDFGFTFSDNKLNPPQNPLEAASDTWLQTEIKKGSGKTPVYYHLRYSPEDLDKARFIQLVEDGIKEIGKDSFEKIVPSRTRNISLSEDFDVVKAFHSLCTNNPNALVSFVSAPETGTWLGATPELLVSLEDKKIFKTIALAGTQPFIDGIDLKAVAWTQKDIEEQALVERYIIGCFKKIRLREYEEHGPKTVVAGNLLHLKSEFKVDMEETNFPQLGTVMLRLLHPTSAVCGTPLEPSLEFLTLREGYDRQFYSGYLGPVNVNNNLYIFVNLRCCQLVENKAILYAGAGVTVDSNPEQEWKETDMKMNTLLRVIGSD